MGISRRNGFRVYVSSVIGALSLTFCRGENGNSTNFGIVGVVMLDFMHFLLEQGINSCYDHHGDLYCMDSLRAFRQRIRGS